MAGCRASAGCMSWRLRRFAAGQHAPMPPGGECCPSHPATGRPVALCAQMGIVFRVSFLATTCNTVTAQLSVRSQSAAMLRLQHGNRRCPGRHHCRNHLRVPSSCTLGRRPPTMPRHKWLQRAFRGMPVPRPGTSLGRTPQDVDRDCGSPVRRTLQEDRISRVHSCLRGIRYASIPQIGCNWPRLLSTLRRRSLSRNRLLHEPIQECAVVLR